MSFNTDGYFDIDECLRTCQMVGSGADIVMGIFRPAVGRIVGEGRMRYNKIEEPMIDVLGYFFDGLPPKGADKQHLNTVTVIKYTDYATPSLLNLFDNQVKDLEVTVSRYHAGGDSRASGQMQPVLELAMENAEIRAISTFTSRHSPVPFDILSFSFRKLTITTRQQLKDGRLGPAYTCVLSNEEEKPQKPDKNRHSSSRRSR